MGLNGLTGQETPSGDLVNPQPGRSRKG